MSKTPDRQPDEWDVPLGGIERQYRQVFERNHIEVAVAEIRFVRVSEQISEADAASVWASLGQDRFPIFEAHKQQMVNVTISPTGAQQETEVQPGWLLATSDRTTAITLMPSSVIVQTQAYDHYSASLGDHLQIVLPLFAEVTGSKRVQRLGIRYINRLTDVDATTPSFWRDRIEASFAAPLRGPFEGRLVGQHQQVQLQLDEAGARIQSGLLPVAGAKIPRWDYLVDLDVFMEKTCDYEALWCGNQLRQLNRTAFVLFTNVLSDEYLETFGPTEPPLSERSATIENPTTTDKDKTQ